jgi:hypothetical protein
MQGVMIGDSYPVTYRRSGAQGMNSLFCRNSLLADTALILLCNIRRVFVVPRSRRQLLGCQTYLHWIPKIALPLS